MRDAARPPGTAAPGAPGADGNGVWPPAPPWAARPRTRRGPPWAHGHRGRGPIRRSGEDRIVAGVAGGLARRMRIDPTIVRIVIVLATVGGGFGAFAYLAAWLLVPLEGHSESVASRVVRDRRGIALALSVVPVLVVAAVVGRVGHVGYVASLAWPVCLSAAAGMLLWRNWDPEERAWIRHAVEPVLRLDGSTPHSRRLFGGRVVLGLALFGVGFWLLTGRQRTGSIGHALAGALLVVAGVVVLFGPWWLRLIRGLVNEREARIRAEDRADMAARVHDSVLQTLALIQRAAGEPQRVVQLARAQERELRAWLFDGDLPGTLDEGVTTLAAAARRIGAEVEAAHGVPIEVVTVGDCALDDRLRALAAAAREATVNAAKWSGAPVISLFAEVERGRVSWFVRDRGRGFDPGAVDADRRGIAQSIEARMVRHGGRAVVRSAPGQGTEVTLTMPATGTAAAESPPRAAWR